MPNEILRVEDLSVSFDGFRVLNSLSLALGAGELRFLIGPNGAGKTTLMDVISGKTRADAGRVVFTSERAGCLELTRMREDAIVRAGIARKFQTPSVFGSLTCSENVEVAAGFRASLPALFRRLSAARREHVRHVLHIVGLDARRDVAAAVLSHGERQWLEIAMLLVQEPELLLLDEPVAGMTRPERERTGEILHSLEGLHSLIVTEHDMDFVRQFSRTVTVLHMGQVLREGPVEEVQRDPTVQEVYMGRTERPPMGVVA